MPLIRDTWTYDLLDYGHTNLLAQSGPHLIMVMVGFCMLQRMPTKSILHVPSERFAPLL